MPRRSPLLGGVAGIAVASIAAVAALVGIRRGRVNSERGSHPRPVTDKALTLTLAAPARIDGLRALGRSCRHRHRRR